MFMHFFTEKDEKIKSEEGLYSECSIPGCRINIRPVSRYAGFNQNESAPCAYTYNVYVMNKAIAGIFNYV